MKLTSTQIKKINEGCQNGFKLDIQWAVLHDEKTLIKNIVLDEKFHVEVKLRHEKTEDGFNVSATMAKYKETDTKNVYTLVSNFNWFKNLLSKHNKRRLDKSLQQATELMDDEYIQELLEQCDFSVTPVAVTDIAEEIKEEKQISFTEMEKQFMWAMCNNNFSDISESGADWLFGVIEQLPYTEQQAKGVISSLVKKDIIGTELHDGEEHEVVFFTENGKKVIEQIKEELPEIMKEEQKEETVAQESETAETVQSIEEQKEDIQEDVKEETAEKSDIKEVTQEPTRLSKLIEEYDETAFGKVLKNFINACGDKLAVKDNKHYTMLYKKMKDGKRDKMLCEIQFKKKSIRLFANIRHLSEDAIALSDTEISSIKECSFEYEYAIFNSESQANIFNVILNDFKNIIIAD